MNPPPHLVRRLGTTWLFRIYLKNSGTRSVPEPGCGRFVFVPIADCYYLCSSDIRSAADFSRGKSNCCSQVEGHCTEEIKEEHDKEKFEKALLLRAGLHVLSGRIDDAEKDLDNLLSRDNVNVKVSTQICGRQRHVYLLNRTLLMLEIP